MAAGIVSSDLENPYIEANLEKNFLKKNRKNTHFSFLQKMTILEIFQKTCAQYVFFHAESESAAHFTLPHDSSPFSTIFHLFRPYLAEQNR